MGRNAGSSIFWTYVKLPSESAIKSWYCQQHSKYKLGTVGVTLTTHIDTQHGNVAQ